MTSKALVRTAKIKSIPKAKRKGMSVNQIDRMIWDQIQLDLLNEHEKINGTPSLVKTAIGCIKNENVKKVLSEYISALEKTRDFNKILLFRKNQYN